MGKVVSKAVKAVEGFLWLKKFGQKRRRPFEEKDHKLAKVLDINSP